MPSGPEQHEGAPEDVQLTPHEEAAALILDINDAYGLYDGYGMFDDNSLDSNADSFFSYLNSTEDGPALIASLLEHRSLIESGEKSRELTAVLVSIDDELTAYELPPDPNMVRVLNQVQAIPAGNWADTITENFSMGEESHEQLALIHSALADYPTPESYLNSLVGKTYIEISSTTEDVSQRRIFNSLKNARIALRNAEKAQDAAPNLATLETDDDAGAPEEGELDGSTDGNSSGSGPDTRAGRAPNNAAPQREVTPEPPRARQDSPDQVAAQNLDGVDVQETPFERADAERALSQEGDTLVVSGMSPEHEQQCRITDFVSKEGFGNPIIPISEADIPHTTIVSEDTDYTWGKAKNGFLSWVDTDGNRLQIINGSRFSVNTEHQGEAVIVNETDDDTADKQDESPEPNPDTGPAEVADEPEYGPSTTLPELMTAGREGLASMDELPDIPEEPKLLARRFKSLQGRVDRVYDLLDKSLSHPEPSMRADFRRRAGEKAARVAQDIGEVMGVMTERINFLETSDPDHKDLAALHQYADALGEQALLLRLTQQARLGEVTPAAAVVASEAIHDESPDDEINKPTDGVDELETDDSEGPDGNPDDQDDTVRDGDEDAETEKSLAERSDEMNLALGALERQVDDVYNLYERVLSMDTRQKDDTGRFERQLRKLNEEYNEATGAHTALNAKWEDLSEQSGESGYRVDREAPRRFQAIDTRLGQVHAYTESERAELHGEEEDDESRGERAIDRRKNEMDTKWDARMEDLEAQLRGINPHLEVDDMDRGVGTNRDMNKDIRILYRPPGGGEPIKSDRKITVRLLGFDGSEYDSHQAVIELRGKGAREGQVFNGVANGLSDDSLNRALSALSSEFLEDLAEDGIVPGQELPLEDIPDADVLATDGDLDAVDVVESSELSDESITALNDAGLEGNYELSEGALSMYLEPQKWIQIADGWESMNSFTREGVTGVEASYDAESGQLTLNILSEEGTETVQLHTQKPADQPEIAVDGLDQYANVA